MCVCACVRACVCDEGNCLPLGSLSVTDCALWFLLLFSCSLYSAPSSFCAGGSRFSSVSVLLLLRTENVLWYERPRHFRECFARVLARVTCTASGGTGGGGRAGGEGGGRWMLISTGRITAGSIPSRSLPVLPAVVLTQSGLCSGGGLWLAARAARVDLEVRVA